jgi:hypothetical protein
MKIFVKQVTWDVTQPDTVALVSKLLQVSQYSDLLLIHVLETSALDTC